MKKVDGKVKRIVATGGNIFIIPDEVAKPEAYTLSRLMRCAVLTKWK